MSPPPIKPPEGTTAFTPGSGTGGGAIHRSSPTAAAAAGKKPGDKPAGPTAFRYTDTEDAQKYLKDSVRPGLEKSLRSIDEFSIGEGAEKKPDEAKIKPIMDSFDALVGNEEFMKRAVKAGVVRVAPDGTRTPDGQYNYTFDMKAFAEFAAKDGDAAMKTAGEALTKSFTNRSEFKIQAPEPPKDQQKEAGWTQMLNFLPLVAGLMLGGENIMMGLIIGLILTLVCSAVGGGQMLANAFGFGQPSVVAEKGTGVDTPVRQIERKADGIKPQIVNGKAPVAMLDVDAKPVPAMFVGNTADDQPVYITGKIEGQNFVGQKLMVPTKNANGTFTYAAVTNPPFQQFTVPLTDNGKAIGVANLPPATKNAVQAAIPGPGGQLKDTETLPAGAGGSGPTPPAPPAPPAPDAPKLKAALNPDQLATELAKMTTTPANTAAIKAIISALGNDANTRFVLVKQGDTTYAVKGTLTTNGKFKPIIFSAVTTTGGVPSEPTKWKTPKLTTELEVKDGNVTISAAQQKSLIEAAPAPRVAPKTTTPLGAASPSPLPGGLVEPPPAPPLTFNPVAVPLGGTFTPAPPPPSNRPYTVVSAELIPYGDDQVKPDPTYGQMCYQLKVTRSNGTTNRTYTFEASRLCHTTHLGVRKVSPSELTLDGIHIVPYSDAGRVEYTTNVSSGRITLSEALISGEGKTAKASPNLNSPQKLDELDRLIDMAERSAHRQYITPGARGNPGVRKELVVVETPVVKPPEIKMPLPTPPPKEEPPVLPLAEDLFGKAKKFADENGRPTEESLAAAKAKTPGHGLNPGTVTDFRIGGVGTPPHRAS